MFLASFLYKLYKKNKEKQEEASEGERIEPSQKSWGVEDLLSQFEQKYGVQQDSEYDQTLTNEAYDNEFEYSDFEKEIEEPVKTVSFDENYSSESANHHAFSPKQSVPISSEVEPDETDGIDLRQMIISNTILTRPEY